MRNLAYDRIKFIYKTETDSQAQKTNFWLLKRKGQGREGETNEEFWSNRGTLLYIKQVNNKDLLYSMEIFSTFVKKFSGNFDRDCTESIDGFGSMIENDPQL